MSAFLGIMFPGGGSGGLPPITPSVGIAYSGSQVGKRISVYNWSSSTGFGSLFTAPSLPNAITQVSFVRNNSNLSASFAVAPYFSVWQWSGLGFGTQYSNPASALNPASGGPTGFTWTSAVDAFLTANITAPSRPQAWAWSQASGFGTKYSNGAALNSGGTASTLAINGDNTQVAFGSNTAPRISLFPWSSATGFGSKYADPATIPTAGPVLGGLSFNAITNDVAIGSGANPFAYPVTSAGFGSKYANPSTSVGGQVYAIRFSPTGSSIAITTNASPGIKVYQWGAGFGTRFAQPSWPFGSISCDWSSTGTEIAAAQTGVSPYTKVWAWTPSGFGASYSDPSTAPGVPNCVSFSNQSR